MANNELHEQLEEFVENGTKEDSKKFILTGIGYVVGGLALASGAYLISKLSDMDLPDADDDIDTEEDEVESTPDEDDQELPLAEVAEKVEENEAEEDLVTEPEKEDSPKGSVIKNK